MKKRYFILLPLLLLALVCCNKQEEPPAHEHTYTEAVTPPTCTGQGFTTFTCACGDTYNGNSVEPLGHSYTEKTVDPTCTEQGFTTFTCTCGDTYNENTVEPLGHDYADFDFLWTGYEACSVHLTCSRDRSHTHDVPLTVTPELTKEATCEKTGLVTYTAVGDYGGVTYHSKETQTIDSIGHAFGKWIVVQEGTETQKYIKERICDQCDGRIRKELTCSVGMEYELTEDGKAYTLFSIGECTDTEIIIPSKYNGLPVIGVDWLSGESGITRVVFPETFTALDAFDLSYCRGLLTVEIPATITIMREAAFYDDINLVNVYYDGTKEEWDRITFENYGNPMRYAEHLFVLSPDGTFVEVAA